MIRSLSRPVVASDPLLLAGRVVLDRHIIRVAASDIYVTYIIKSNSFRCAGTVVNNPLLFAD
jgi:hypothetical protein